MTPLDEYVLEGTPPLPEAIPIDGVTEWHNQLFVAQGGCIWVQRGDDWTLASEEHPPGFPPRREAQEA